MLCVCERSHCFHEPHTSFALWLFVCFVPLSLWNRILFWGRRFFIEFIACNISMCFFPSFVLCFHFGCCFSLHYHTVGSFPWQISIITKRFLSLFCQINRNTLIIDLRHSCVCVFYPGNFWIKPKEGEKTPCWKNECFRICWRSIKNP